MHMQYTPVPGSDLGNLVGMEFETDCFSVCDGLHLWHYHCCGSRGSLM